MLRNNHNSIYSKMPQAAEPKPEESKKLKNKDSNYEVSKRMRQEQKAELKLISQAAKTFNIHLHSQNLFKDNEEYLRKLNQKVNK